MKKDIEQYLRDNAPGIPDEGQFLIETNARLRNVEGIKQTVDTERRRGREFLFGGIALLSIALGVVSLGKKRQTL